MQLIIDTEKDSSEKLKKAARFLSDLAGDHSYAAPQEQVVPDASPGMFNMFSESSESTSPVSESVEPTVEPESEEKPELIPY